MPRNKRWPYNSGLHVPLLVRIPEKFAHLRPDDYESGGTTDRLVGFIDMAPRSSALQESKSPNTSRDTPSLVSELLSRSLTSTAFAVVWTNATTSSAA